MHIHVLPQCSLRFFSHSPTKVNIKIYPDNKNQVFSFSAKRERLIVAIGRYYCFSYDKEGNKWSYMPKITY
jgi:hypothetical protein